MASYTVFVLVFVAMVTTVYSISYPTRRPQAFSCPANEEYYECQKFQCYKTCQQLNVPQACPAVSSDCYDPACLCIDNYLRNNDGVCVPEKQCYTP